MQFYTKKNPQTLPDWAIVVSNIAGLIEVYPERSRRVEINDTHPCFQSLLEKLETEIQPGIFGVKATDLCSQLSVEMSKEELENEDYHCVNIVQPEIQSWAV